MLPLFSYARMEPCSAACPCILRCVVLLWRESETVPVVGGLFHAIMRLVDLKRVLTSNIAGKV